MHELAIAGAVVELAAKSAGGRRVRRVQLTVGHLRQVVPAALAFSFELVAEGTVVEGAELVIEQVPAEGVCRACGVQSRQAEFPLRCAACGGLDLEIVRGEELHVEWLDVEEAEEAEEASV
jgi:hydrogenase nickel incorporation protein HypA/HybF